MRFLKKNRLLSRYDYIKAARGRRCFSGECVLIDYTKTRLGRCRLGITVSRKFGGAVERNYFKRLVREAFRLLPDVQMESYDLNVRPKTSKTKEPAVPTTLPGVQEDFKRLVTYLRSSPFRSAT